MGESPFHPFNQTRTPNQQRPPRVSGWEGRPYPHGLADVRQPGAHDLGAVVLGQRQDQELLVAAAASAVGPDPCASKPRAGEGQLPASAADASRRVLEAHGGARSALAVRPASGFGRVEGGRPQKMPLLPHGLHGST